MTARNNIFSTFSRRVDVLLLAVCLRSGTSCFLIQNNPSFVPGHNIQNRPPFVRYSHQDDSLTENEDKIKHLNPNMDPLRKSISDINYSQVILGLDNLYPPNELSQRISKSRSDGYWSYVEDGMKPSQELTYGEFDFYFFAELLDRACHHYYRNEDNVKRLNNEQQNGLNGKTFVDIGSGTGRLVIGAAALHPGLSLSKGIEILPGIHESALESLEQCKESSKRETHEKSDSLPEKVDVLSSEKKLLSSFTSITADPMSMMTNEQWKRLSLGSPSVAMGTPTHETINGDQTSITKTKHVQTEKDDVNVDEVSDTTTFYSLYCPDNDDAVSLLPLAPVEFSCGSYEDPYEYIGDADIVFVFSTCWTEDMMSSLSECIGRQCKPGTIAITTEFSMPLKGEIGETLSDPSLAFGKYELDLVEEVDGFCWLTGGTSTAYIHRVVSSLWEEGAGPRQKPRVEPKEVAWKIIQEYESNRLTDSSKFVRNAKNALAFYNFKNPQQPL
mmetsp:Transcript_11264/g.13076  ORF Transcript_11264/g.13076 Transcript_11264/m.13076 type:complete len:500 (-) Transcript_11264:2219-3718(-)